MQRWDCGCTLRLPTLTRPDQFWESDRYGTEITLVSDGAAMHERSPCINLERVWEDDDMVELKIDVADGASAFCIKAYVANAQLEAALVDLKELQKSIKGGICDLRFGAFGPEYASGAFEMRLHFANRGALYITCRLESDYRDFSVNKVASHAQMYLRSEPALLDNFVEELRGVIAKERFDATLQGFRP